jgi:hypothetical protein
MNSVQLKQHAVLRISAPQLIKKFTSFPGKDDGRPNKDQCQNDENRRKGAREKNAQIPLRHEKRLPERFFPDR